MLVVLNVREFQEHRDESRCRRHECPRHAIAKLDFDPMKIHEYQAKAILAKYDVPVPRGEVAFSVDEADPGTVIPAADALVRLAAAVAS